MKSRRITGITAVACFAVAAVLFGWSLTERSKVHFYASIVQKCESRIALKQKAALLTGEQLARQERVHETDSDVAAFYLSNGKLQSWTASDIPVSETVLAGIDTTRQFLQLGHHWYVAQAFRRDTATIVTAVLIKKEYAYENDFLKPQVNAFLPAADITDIIPLTEEAAPYTVKAADGTPLFALVFDSAGMTTKNLAYRWGAVALLLVSLFAAMHCVSKCWMRMAGILVLVLLRCMLAFAGPLLEPDNCLFSSSLYADSSFIPSLGNLLIQSVFAFLVVAILLQQYRHSQGYVARHKNRIVGIGLCGSVAFAGLIHYVLRSLIMNSTIPLNLPQLDRLTAYTFVAYGILILLYATLFLWLYMTLGPLAHKCRRIKPRGYVWLFMLCAVLYTLISLEGYGHRKEEMQAKAWADKLVVEHDPMAELFLREMTDKLTGDTRLRQQILREAYTDEVHEYLMQQYMQGYMQHYDLQVTICPQYTKLQVDEKEIDCLDFFNGELARYGTPVDTVFYYIANDNGRNSYLGKLSFSDNAKQVVLFLELDSKLHSGGEGYPELLLEKNIARKIRIPAGYSYAKYADKRLVSSYGNYPYPHRYQHYFPEGARQTVNNGYAHLLFYPDARYMIVISRPAHTFWSLTILFSYLFILLGIGLPVLWWVAGIALPWRLSPNTFRRKIAALLIASFVVSIVSTAVFSISYNVDRYRKSAWGQMEEKIHTVLVRLDTYLSNEHTMATEDDLEFERELYLLSNSMHIDINLYDTSGRLVATSRPEIFEKQLQSTRMNRAALNRLSRGRIMEYRHKETIGNFAFYSMYATYHNLRGTVTGYVNIPYFARRMSDIRDVSAIVTAIVNMYILTLIIAMLVGGMLTSRILRPLEIVRRHMQRLDVTRQMDYIRYDEKDELGDLIRAYNQMVRDLEESTRKLAQSEREGAWRQMAKQIAHEIKNPLTPMRLSIQHLMRLKRENAPDWQARMEELLPALLEQIDTLAKTASEFSTLTKTTTDKAVDVSLNNLIDELRPLFDTYTHIRFEWQATVSRAVVRGHADQLLRVLVNLLTNAVQAVQNKPEGKICVSLEEQAPDYIIRIDDNGDGVQEDLQVKLFTPDFTTKNSGSGLGLAISKNIIEQQGGCISYRRSALGGACFTVQLPKHAGEAG
jgi:signal transduction histidine kinase